jgi:ribosomal protein S18 acetylase RimI-like enzyme
MTTTFSLPGQPDIPGLSFRRYAGPDDLAPLWGVMHAQGVADGDLDDLPPPEAFAALFAHPIGWSPEADVLIAEVDGEVVAWSRTQHQPMPDEDAFRSRGYVAQAFRRRGLGRAMLAQNEHDLRRTASGLQTTRSRAFHGWATDRMPGATALFRGAGYVPFHHYFEMARPAGLDIPAVDDGLVIETPTADDARAFWRTMNRAFGGHWGNWIWSESELAQRVARVLEDPSTGPGLWRMIRLDGQIVAAIATSFDPDTRTGSIDDLGTLPGYRGRRFGSGLLGEAIAELTRRGAREITLQVDADDLTGALGLYHRFGFTLAKQGIGFRRPME